MTPKKTYGNRPKMSAFFREFSAKPKHAVDEKITANDTKNAFGWLEGQSTVSIKLEVTKKYVRRLQRTEPTNIKPKNFLCLSSIVILNFKLRSPIISCLFEKMILRLKRIFGKEFSQETLLVGIC